MKRAARYAPSVLILILSALTTAHARDVTEVVACGQVIYGDGFLTADLDCSSYSERAAVGLATFGTLDLRGHMITAHMNHNAVACGANCAVLGGGTLMGGFRAVGGPKKVNIRDTTILGSNWSVYGGTRAQVENVTIRDSARDAVTSPRAVVIRNSVIENNGGFPDPRDGIVKQTSAVIFATRIKVLDSSITNNAWGGVEGDSVLVRDSVVTGNGANSACGVTYNCKFDVGSLRHPRARGVTCDVSLNMGECSEACGCHCNGDSPVNADTSPEFHNWGICSSD